jgi:DnaK suppressor protein
VPLRRRVGLVQVAQRVLARLVRGDDLGLDPLLELLAAQPLDVALDLLDVGRARKRSVARVARVLVARGDYPRRDEADRDDQDDYLGGALDPPEATRRSCPYRKSPVSDDLDLAEIERVLRARQVEMREKIAGLAKAPERGSGISFGKRVGDGTTEAVSRLNEIGIGNNLEVALERVDRALAKIDEGTYGTCDNCRKPISPARLRVAPESALCIECARG